MTSHFIFWPWFAGLVFLALGLIFVRKQLSFKLNGLIVLGPVFVAAPLAIFGAEHLVGAKFLMQMVPPWMPARLFWAYFVGLALFAAATSMVTMKYVRLSGLLLGLMFLLFVLTIHAPRVAANPRDRIAWAVALRDLTFAAGAWALAGTHWGEWRVRDGRRLIAISRAIAGVVLVFFGIEHFLHPEFVPGVPLEMLTPGWIPAGRLWGYLTGMALLVGGGALLINKKARATATLLGLWIALVVVFIYFPILAAAKLPSGMNEAINYIGDTLLFSGTILLIAAAVPVGSIHSDAVRAAKRM